MSEPTADQSASAGPAATTPGRDVLGPIALAAAVAGVVLACLSATVVVGWVLLGLGLVLGVVGVFRSGRSRAASIAAIVVAVVGAVVAAVVFVSMLGSAVAGGPNRPDPAVPAAPHGADSPIRVVAIG